MIGLSCYILADTFFIAQGIGSDGLTALNLALPVYSLINGLGLMIGMGGATRYSIAAGSGNSKIQKEVFTLSFCFTLFLSFFFVLAGIFLPFRLASLMGADASILPMCGTYLRVLMVFTPMFMINNLLVCFVRNDGNPHLSTIAMLIGSFSNIVLDYIFVFPLQMGIQGAALATGAAPVISILLISRHMLQKKNHFHFAHVTLHIRKFFDISLLGISSLISELSSGIVMLVFNMLILKSSGNLGVAAYGIIANIALVLISIFTGIAQGIQPVLSLNYGRNETNNIRSVRRYSLAASVLFALLSYAVTSFFASPIAEVFNKDHDPALTAMAVHGLRIYFTAFLFIGINIITASYLSSIDQPLQGFVISLLRGFILVVPIAFLLSTLFGLTGIWMTLPIAEALVCIISFCFIFRSSKSSSFSRHGSN